MAINILFWDLRPEPWLQSPGWADVIWPYNPYSIYTYIITMRNETKQGTRNIALDATFMTFMTFNTLICLVRFIAYGKNEMPGMFANFDLRDI